MDDLAAADSCVFCAIVAGRADSSLVHSGEHVVAFMDVRPLTPGHLLVVPRTAGDGFGIRAQRGTPSRLELDAEASQIRVAGAALA